jgi:hypothetical protein
LPGIAWTMQEENGWWAYCADECPIGPFLTEAEACRGLRHGAITRLPLERLCAGLHLLQSHTSGAVTKLESLQRGSRGSFLREESSQKKSGPLDGAPRAASPFTIRRVQFRTLSSCYSMVNNQLTWRATPKSLRVGPLLKNPGS